MIANNSAGCSQDQSQVNSITHKESVALWERRKEELMKLSKKDLVELLIGRREYVGMTFG